MLDEWRDRLQNLLGAESGQSECPSQLESLAARYSVICQGFLTRVTVATLQTVFPNSVLHLEGTCSHPVSGQHKRTEGLAAWALLQSHGPCSGVSN